MGAVADEVRVDVTELVRLAAVVLDAADGLSDGLGAVRTVNLSSAAFGNSGSVSAMFAGQQGVAEDAGTAVEDLVGVVEADSDRIYRVAFAYQAADEAALRSLHSQHLRWRGLDGGV